MKNEKFQLFEIQQEKFSCFLNIQVWRLDIQDFSLASSIIYGNLSTSGRWEHKKVKLKSHRWEKDAEDGEKKREKMLKTQKNLFNLRTDVST